MASGDMRDVIVLDDVPDDDEPGGAAGGPGTRSSRRARARRRPARWLVAVLVVTSAVAAAAAVDARSGRVESLAGGLAPLGTAPATLWRHPAAEVHATTPSGDLLVGRHRAGDDEVVELVDGDTGASRWTAALPGDPREVTCVPVQGTAGSEGGQVACRLLVREPSSGADDGAAAVASHLVVLDAGTGATVADRPLGDRDSTLTSLGPDLVRVELLADRHVRVTREDAVGGDVRWTVRSPRPVRWTGVPGRRDGGGLPTPVPSVQQGLVVVAGGPAAWVLSPGGTLLGEWLPLASARATVDVTVLADGRFAVTETAPTGTVTPRSSTAAAGTARPELATTGSVSETDARDGFVIGSLLEPSLDDGSADDLLLTRSPSGRQVVALDRGTGAARWRARLSPGDAVVLDGRVVLASPDGVTALDAATGRTVWHERLGGLRPHPQLLTDGRVVVVLRWGPASARRLTALDVVDGRERWTVAAPDGTVRLHVVQGRLVARTPDEVVAVGPDARG